MELNQPTKTAVLKDDLSFFSNIKSLPGKQRKPEDNTENIKYLKRQVDSESNAISYPKKLPFALAQAKGIYLKDVDGNVYYDCLSGAGAIALGHNHEVVQNAIKETLESNLPLLTLDITTPIKEQFIKEILSCFPKEFAKNAKVQFCSPSGSDAVEAAMKLVKVATGRRSMVAFHGGYHGMSLGSLSLMGNLGSKSQIPGLMSEVHFLPYPYSYRCPMGNCNNSCDNTCSNYIQNVLQDDESGITKPAGVIVEAIQGEGGKIPAPNEWLQNLRKTTKEQGIPLIIDEVQTGLGRSGKMFAFEYSGIIPDVVVLSKAIGGSLPLAIVVYNRDLDKWGPGTHAGTFRGNQLAMATGIATIKFIKENHLLENVIHMGELFKINFAKIQSETKCIGDIRGKGLMLGVEIINSNSDILESGQPPRYEKLSRLIQLECFKRGLVIEIGGRQSNVLRFMPPLTITTSQVNHICEIFKDAVLAAENSLLVKSYSVN